MQEHTTPSTPCIGIAGLGLIGGSLARALGPCWAGARRVGFDADPAVGAAALAAGCVDNLATDFPALLAQCDLVVLCQPVPALLAALAQAAAAPRLPVVCDVASVKSVVLEAADRALGARRGRFVGAHPIAGKAAGGLAASDARLFDGRTVIVCGENADADALALVRSLWQRVGGRLVALGAREHDQAYAGLSHLPQLMTWAYLAAVADESWTPQAGKLAGPGFASFTRLGDSPAPLWAGIVMHNRAPVASLLSKAATALEDMRQALEAGQADRLEGLFEQARTELHSISGTSCR